MGVDAGAGLRIGGLGGLVAITCCVSPVVLYAAGAVTAANAVTLGNELYGSYAWHFRAAGGIVGVALAAQYLRSRGRCDLRTARASWRTLAVAGGIGVATYLALYAATTWLGSRAST